MSTIVSHGSMTNLQEGNVVKALYFTRASEPFSKSVYKHIGIYAYRVKALKKFISLPQSRLEIEERLLATSLENNLNIGCVFVNDHVISVDSKQMIL